MELRFRVHAWPTYPHKRWDGRYLQRKLFRRVDLQKSGFFQRRRKDQSSLPEEFQMICTDTFPSTKWNLIYPLPLLAVDY